MLTNFTINNLSGFGFFAILIPLLLTGTGLVIAFSHYFAKYILMTLIEKIFDRNRTGLRSLLLKNQIFYRVAYLVPAFILHHFSYLFNFESKHLNLLLADIVNEITAIYIIIGIALVLSGILNCVEERYNQFTIAKSKPIKSYLQVGKLILFVIASILAASILFNQPPMYFFAGVGTTTAFLALVFKDSVMGFIASVQLAAYDMVRIGDWIEIPTFGVDGDVIEISLNTVKVQNSDKSVVTIPSYALLTSGVKNWRNMYESGGRRVKRSIMIDTNSIKLHDNSTQTNLGLFREYLETYLRKHKSVHQEMKLLVRHLPGTTSGLPVELYFFANETASEKYEAIQAEIIEHTYAVLSRFDLRVFQSVNAE